MSPVKDADPAAEELSGAFAEAMSGPSKPRSAPPPPEIDREAPHGRDENGVPLAPHGHTKAGLPKLTAAGRKSATAKDDQARTAPAVPDGKAPGGPAAGGPALEASDFSAGLMDFSETVWFGGSIAAKVGPQLPLVGRLVPGRKLAATMAIFDFQRPALCSALNLAAAHDTKARQLAAKLAAGEASWALQCIFLIAPFTAAVSAVWQGDQALAGMELPGLDELAKSNEHALDQMFARMAAQMEAAQQAQAAALNEQGDSDAIQAE